MTKQRSKRLIRLTLVLFLLEVITFPFVVKLTYPGNGNGVDRTLTYVPGKLVWDNAKQIDENGTAIISLFSDSYTNAKSGNKDKILAPGVNVESIVRLQNNANYEIEYTVVAYKIASSELLNPNVKINGTGFKDTDVYPTNMKYPDSTVSHAVTGKLSAKQLQDFDISVFWDFDINDSIDSKDTQLGQNSSNGKPEELTIALIVYVTDLNYGTKPIPPLTGDRTPFVLYLILILISAIVLILLLLERRRQDKKEEKNLAFEAEMQAMNQK